MLAIRKEQTAALREAAILKFENQMFHRLQEGFPEECALIEEPRIRGWIRHSIERAEAFRITRESEVAHYIDVMFALWRDFDQPETAPWVVKVLSDANLIGHAKMEKLSRMAPYELQALRVMHGR